MRNFFEYVEKGKEEIVGVDSTDVLLEGFKEDLMRIENLDSIKAFIIGFLAGSGVNIKENKTNIETILKKSEILSISEVLKALKVEEGKDITSIKKSLLKGLTQLKPIIKSEEKME